MRNFLRNLAAACGLLLVFAAVAGTSFGQIGGGGPPPDPPTPEINPASASGALTLLVGGVLLLADKVRFKK